MTHIPLFRAWSFIDNFSTRWGPCDHLCMNWFVTSRRAPVVLYEDAIHGYVEELAALHHPCEHRCFHVGPEKDWRYAINAVDELFTESEVDALRRYLVSLDTAVEIERAELPLPPDIIGYRDIGVGHGEGCVMLNEREAYPLSLPVWGWCDFEEPTVRFHNRRPPHFFWTLGELLGQSRADAGAE